MFLQTAQWPGLIPSVGFLQYDKHCLGKLNIDAANVGFLTVLVPQRAKTGRQWEALLFASACSILFPLWQTCASAFAGAAQFPVCIVTCAVWQCEVRAV